MLVNEFIGSFIITNKRITFTNIKISPGYKIRIAGHLCTFHKKINGFVIIAAFFETSADSIVNSIRVRRKSIETEKITVIFSGGAEIIFFLVKMIGKSSNICGHVT